MDLTVEFFLLFYRASSLSEGGSVAQSTISSLLFVASWDQCVRYDNYLLFEPTIHECLFDDFSDNGFVVLGPLQFIWINDVTYTCEVGVVTDTSGTLDQDWCTELMDCFVGT